MVEDLYALGGSTLSLLLEVLILLEGVRSLGKYEQLDHMMEMLKVMYVKNISYTL